MRYATLPFVACLFLAACGPSEGEVYEHKLNRKRVKIESTGPCAEIAASVDRAREFGFEIGEESGISRGEMITSGLVSYPTVIGDSTETDCVSYEGKIRTQGVTATQEIILPTDDFLEDYRPLD